MKDDTISRQAAIDALNGIINRFEQILRDIRESKVDDSVCGMCEYDGAFVGQSGDWCNECPGFEKNDCFKLSDECRKRWLESVKLPSAQQWIPCEERLPEEEKAYLVTFANEKVGMSSWHKDTFNRGFNRGFDVYLIGVTEDGECEYFGVVAWMEKPEPWKGEDNG